MLSRPNLNYRGGAVYCNQGCMLMLTRKRAKWICTIACGTTVVIAIASIWCGVGVNLKRFGCGIYGGQISAWWWEYCDYGYDEEVDSRVGIFPAGFALCLPSFEKETHIYPLGETTAPTGAQWILILPLWLILLLLALPTAILWWLDRRRIREGCCRKCGYDLTGNVSGTCLECSTAIETDAAVEHNNHT